MSDFALANYVESGLWLCVALLLGVVSIRRRDVERRRAWQAAAVFAVFAGSDVVEAHTAAWWRPWWLLAWKTACVAALLGLLVDYWRRRGAAAKQ